MAHKLQLYSDEEVKPVKKKRNITGKFGFAFYIGEKEYFLGLSVNDIVTEQLIRRKTIKTPKGRVAVLGFDPIG